MKFLLLTLCVSLAVALGRAAPTHHDIMPADPPSHPDQSARGDGHYNTYLDRCDGIEFDAIAPDEKGITYFFKGDHLWRGFSGPAHMANETFKELDEHHHLGHVDAAFRMHNKNDPQGHDHLFFFLDDKVFSYYNNVLEKGYPMAINQVFPNIPSHLDAAVECPKGECNADSVIFFKGSTVYHYDIETQIVKTREWSHLPNCTSVFRWQEHYYCFHGHNFTRFEPTTGQWSAAYPKDARNYFMKCPNFGHGHGSRRPQCSEVKMDAITSDDAGKMYAFRGKSYIRLDAHRDGTHPFPISRAWKEITDGVDAVFSYGDKFYMIKGDQVYIYKSAASYVLIEGYPKTLKEELGIDGPVDAALVCEGHHIVHIIKGQRMYDVDLAATPRTVTQDYPLPLSNIDAAMCGPDEVLVYKGSEYYKYESPQLFAKSRIMPQPLKISPEMFGCEE